MKLSFEKMRKVHLVCLIVIGIIASNLHNVHCCKTRRSRRHHKQLPALKDEVKRDIVHLPYDNANIPDGNSYEADHINTLSDLVKGLTLEPSRKIKRNTPDFQNVPSFYNNDELKDNNNKTAPHTLIATLADHDDAEALFQNRKIKRAPSDKPRRIRDRKYMCLCEETKCSVKDCLQNQIHKSPKTEDDEDTSAEELDDANVIKKAPEEPKKFNIPFANNVNFDQRVIVGDSKAKPPPNTFYPVYANPQVYHYTPYTLAHPGLIYTGVTPMQQNYAPAATYNQFPSPSPIPAHLLKLWKNGAQNLLPVDSNGQLKQTPPQYVPNYSLENTKNDAESGRVTTPRQVYSQNNPSQGNIEDLRPAYSYSTDFPYNNQPYTTEVVSADLLKFITEKPKQLQFGDPTTTNYAPSYYTTKRTADQQAPGYRNNAAYPSSNQYDYNGMPTLPPGYQSQEEPESDELSIEVDKMINDYRNNVPTMSVPNDADLRAYNPPPQSQRPPDFVIQPPASYNIQTINPPRQEQQSNTEINVPQRATTLEDVNNGYASHYNPQKTATLRNADGYNAAVSKIASDSMEGLFRGLEKIILNNATVSDTPQMQAVDERPSTTYENPDNALVQNAVKKVLNNFVPGKSEDLLANYGTERSRELARDNGESLSPDLANTHVLKNLLNVPEVENMIVETTGNLINQVMGSAVPESVIRDTLRNVVNNEIPRPTSPPPPKRNTLNFQIRLTKRVPRYDDSANREVFEKIKSIINKSELGEEAASHPLAQNLIVKTVKHSIDKEKGVADEATIRRAFNQLMRSRGSDNNMPLIVQPSETMNNYDRGAPQGNTAYTTEDTGYKLAPPIPVKERRLQGGTWVETPKTLVGNQVPAKSFLEEKRRKELEKQLDMLQQYDKPNVTEDAGSPYTQKSDVTTREAVSQFYDGRVVTADPTMAQYAQQANGYPSNPVVTTINYDYRSPSYNNVQQPSNNYDSRNPSYIVTEQPRNNYDSQSPSYTNMQQPSNNYDNRDPSYTNVQQPSNNYDSRNPSYIVTEQPRNNYDDRNPSYTNTQQPSNNYDNRNPSYTSAQQPNNNYDSQNPSYTSAQQPSNNYDNRTPRYTTTQQPSNNQLNLLVDSTQSSTVDQKAEEPYMGKLVPVNAVNGNADNSNLVWVGDGVRLPLTMRKMPDGSYALTLSDEVCKMFVHKKCPCCLPDGGQGVIVRERRNDESDYEDEARPRKQFANEASGNYRVRRDSGEQTTTLKTISNAIGKHRDFQDADYDSSEEDNLIERGAPYKYQRYANEDRIIAGRTRAIGNMLKWMKNVVTEAHEKRQRRSRSSGGGAESKHKVLLF